ncbi:MAG TPA: ATPase, T2SS/T4P/T4SS family [Candidatus Brocadiia bacterium]|nr:ATPase, T2SS/T4P/T4SS family [Candidatus Brocadiia bacterium]
MPEMDEQQPKKLLGRILKEMHLVTESQIQEALAIQKERGGAIGSILVKLNYVTNEEVTMALAVQAGMEVVDLDKTEIPPEVIDRVSASVAQVYRVIPVSYHEGNLTVALANPMHLKTLDDLRFLLDCEVTGSVSNEDAVNRALHKYYRDSTESVQGLIDELDKEYEGIQFSASQSESVDIASLEEMANIAPVRKLLNLILLQAIKDKASDIHFEPFEDEFKIRYRVDGVLYEMVPPPKHLALALTSRIKVMSRLDIAERRRPQDGRVELNVSGNPVDLRVSCLPTMFGESVVLRVLDRSVVALDIEKLGFRPDELENMRTLMAKPNGIVLVTGPTGSGKTTTLYGCLNALNAINVKIITTEDPVEYDLEGIMQVQINSDIGVTFARCLRAILRQDPDIILVGEVRDVETGQIAIQASLTGHLVFTTLHTNDTPSAVTRLLDLGLEPYLLCATVEGIVGQRLVRRICNNCKEEFEPTTELLMELGLVPEEVRGKKFFFGRGCDQCNNTGYRGRMAIFEMLMLNDEMRQLILTNASTQELRECSRKYGTRSLRESGLLAIYDGMTTIEEVARETLVEE